MKTKIIAITGILVLSTLFVSTNFQTKSNFVELDESPVDVFSNGEKINLQKNLVVGEDGEVEVSDTFVQYGLIEHEGSEIYAMRYATAVKGDITSISYQRGHVDGLDDVNPVQVTTVYEGITANGSTYYYNPEASSDGLTTEESYAGKYYWACFTIRFVSGETHMNKDFPVSLTVNGEIASERTANLGTLIELDSHGCNLCDGCKEATCESHEEKCACEMRDFAAVDDRVGLNVSPNAENAYKRPEATQNNISLKAYGDTITLTYNVYSASSCNANLYFNMSGLENEHNINEIFSSVTINGDSVVLDSMIHVGELYFSYDKVFINEVSLNEGSNEIVIVYSIESKEYHINFRSLLLETNNVELTWAEKLSATFYAVDDRCTLETVGSALVKKNKDTNTISFGAVGDTVATLTYNIKADSDCVADLSVITTALPGGVKINNVFKSISINDTDIDISSQIFHDGAVWSNFADVAIGEVSLKEGQNVIKVSYALPSSSLCINFRGITLSTFGGVSWYE